MQLFQKRPWVCPLQNIYVGNYDCLIDSIDWLVSVGVRRRLRHALQTAGRVVGRCAAWRDFNLTKPATADHAARLPCRHRLQWSATYFSHFICNLIIIQFSCLNPTDTLFACGLLSRTSTFVKDVAYINLGFKAAVIQMRRWSRSILTLTIRHPSRYLHGHAPGIMMHFIVIIIIRVICFAVGAGFSREMRMLQNISANVAKQWLFQRCE